MKRAFFLCLLAFFSLSAQAGDYTNSLGMEFIEIPAGRFEIGACSKVFFETCGDEAGYMVTIEKSFYLGKTEVTQAQWEKVMGSNPSKFKGSDRPVEQVSWDDVQEFIKRLNQKEGGNKYRLPTEAEWEYAARAGNPGTYSFGNDESKLGEYAWYSENSGSETHPVGGKKPNAWGLHDMHGNVWEWTCSAYTETYDGNETLCNNHADSPRSLRGGSWYFNASFARSADRVNWPPDARNSNYSLGFRLARIF